MVAGVLWKDESGMDDGVSGKSEAKYCFLIQAM